MGTVGGIRISAYKAVEVAEGDRLLGSSVETVFERVCSKLQRVRRNHQREERHKTGAEQVSLAAAAAGECTQTQRERPIFSDLRRTKGLTARTTRLKCGRLCASDPACCGTVSLEPCPPRPYRRAGGSLPAILLAQP